MDKDTPPAFIWHTCEDKTVPLENSLLMVEALRKQEIPFDYHVYAKVLMVLTWHSRDYDKEYGTL
ncbi:MAG: prolyl oligopeptidase family serine peptidase [Lachnospira eligens]